MKYSKEERDEIFKIAAEILGIYHVSTEIIGGKKRFKESSGSRLCLVEEEIKVLRDVESKLDTLAEHLGQVFVKVPALPARFVLRKKSKYAARKTKKDEK